MEKPISIAFPSMTRDLFPDLNKPLRFGTGELWLRPNRIMKSTTSSGQKLNPVIPTAITSVMPFMLHIRQSIWRMPKLVSNPENIWTIWLPSATSRPLNV